jgi:[acyl-carrier-protein] S-malonyltransferase
MTEIAISTPCSTARYASPIAVLAPGQGAQKPGLLLPWVAQDDAARQLARWSDLCGIDLIRLGTTAEAAELVDTAAVQPLVVAAALLGFAALDAAGILDADTIVAGHSVGELAAAAVAGVLEPQDAIALAAVRGRVMAQACAQQSTGMSAVLGGDAAAVLDLVRSLGMTVANRNGAGQIVVAGPSEALRELRAAPPAGAKIVALPVAGAFHTDFMRPARSAFAAAVRRIEFSDPVRPLLSNYDGKPVVSGADALTKVVGQLTGPVRWDLCLAAIRAASVAAIVELPPAGILTGIAKRELPDIPGHSVKTPSRLTALVESLVIS